MSMLRAEIEAAIDDEEEALLRAVDLIQRRVCLPAWPGEDRMCLALALQPTDMGDIEAWKAWALAVHLFGPQELDVSDAIGPPPSQPTHQEHRRAERLRADLKSLIRLRSGLLLL